MSENLSRELVDYLIVSSCKAALKAGDEILSLYKSNEDIDAQPCNRGVVTKADKMANETIKESLSATRIPIMSEEGRNILFKERYSWELYWLIDPLDGTREFVNKIDEFAVSIALMNNNRPFFGVIYLPSEDKLYFSDPDRGSFMVEKGSEKNNDELNITKLITSAKRLRKRDKEKNEEKIRVVVTRSHMNEKTLEVIKNLRLKEKEVEIVNCGSAKKFCMVADLSADIYFRTTPLYDWDIAAGEAIVRGAGAQIKTFDGEEIAYNKEELIIAPFMVAYNTNLEIKTLMSD